MAFAFTIKDVCSVLGLVPDGASGRDDFYVTCPFCGKKRKLNINTAKDTWHCAACDEGGGMLELYAKMKNLSVKEAFRQVSKELSVTGQFLPNNNYREEKPRYIMPKAAGIEKRDTAYRQLLLMLALSEKHKKNLLERGLTEEAIKSFGYVSFPQRNLREISENLCQRVSLKGIPGFYGTDGKYRLVYRKDGFLIPVKTLSGQISGLQIRYDSLPESATERQKEVYRKYVWLSSSEKEDGNSVSGCENVHHTGFYKGSDISKVILTEGVLKADVASFLSGLPFIGLVGVNNSSKLPKALDELKRLGTRKLYIAFDMDSKVNPNVRKALDKVSAIGRLSGLETTILEWDSRLKGVDDLLQWKKCNGFI